MCLCALCLTTTAGCRSEEAFNWSQLATASVTPTAQPSLESQPLKVSMPAASGALDPLTNPSLAMQGLFKLAFEGVMRLGDRYQPENWLAESVERTEGGYTITLRQGVLFHDGKGLTAKDVADSYEAIKSAEESPWKDVIAPISGMTAEGERVLKVETEAGYAALYALTFPVVSAQEGAAFPAGTGPYAVTAYSEGASMTLARNESWWRTPALIPAIQVTAREDAESVLNTFLTGEIDVCAVDMLTVSSVAQRGNVKRQDYLTGQAELLLPNLSGKLQDVRLREAVAYALNKRDIIANTYQNHGVAVDVPVLPDSWLAERTSGVEHDPEAARAKLEEAGWTDLDGDNLVERHATGPAPTPDPEEDEPAPTNSEALNDLLGGGETPDPGRPLETLTLTILTNEEDSSLHKDAAGRIVTQLVAAGFAAQVESVPFDKLDAAIQAGDYDLLLIGYQLPDTGDLSSLLRTGGSNNRMGYSSAQMDAALDALAAALTAEDYYNAMQQVYDLIAQDLPLYTLCMRTRTQVAGEGVTVPGVIRQSEPYRGIEGWTNVE
jgi:peptide/nickel transport system substrate-binding protein